MELMVKTDPKLYRKYILKDSTGHPILSVQLQKALYGMLKSMLNFYHKLVVDLVSLGYTLNTFDPCMANKLIDGSNLTTLMI